MKFKLSELVRLPEKKTSIGPMGDDERDMLIYNQAIDQISELTVEVDLEKLAWIIHKTGKNWEKLRQDIGNIKTNPYFLQPGPMYMATEIASRLPEVLK